MSQRKECMFCGCNNCKISREHAWPNWARKLLAPSGKSTIEGFRHKNRPDQKYRFTVADDMGITVNDVCKERCNEGWMHDLETAIEPLLTSLIQFGNGIGFNREQQTGIARWALKTAMVFEFTGTDAPFYTFSERDHLRQYRLAPSLAYTSVWTAQYRGPHMSLSYGTRIGFDMQVGSDLIPMDAHSATISLGQFMFQTLTVRVPQGFYGILEFPMLERWAHRTQQVWPAGDVSVWPPNAFIKDEAEFREFLGRFEVGPILLRR